MVFLTSIILFLNLFDGVQVRLNGLLHSDDNCALKVSFPFHSADL